MHVPDGTVWEGYFPLRPGSSAELCVVRVREQGWTHVHFEIEHAHGKPVARPHGSLPTPAFTRRFTRLF